MVTGSQRDRHSLVEQPENGVTVEVGRRRPGGQPEEPRLIGRVTSQAGGLLVATPGRVRSATQEERCGESLGELARRGGVGAAGPGDGSPHVGAECVEVLAPRRIGLTRTQGVQLGHAPPGVTSPVVTGDSPPFALLGRELTDRVEGAIRRRRARCRDEETVAGEAAQAVGDGDLVPVDDRRCRLEREPGGEHRHGAEQPLSLIGQQVVAPGDRLAQGPVPMVLAGSSRQDLQAVAEPGHQPVDPQRGIARRRELDRQRHALEPAAEESRLTRVRTGRRPGRVGPLHEERDGIAVAAAVGRVLREAEAVERVHPLGGEAQPNPTGRDERHRR